MSNTPLPPHLRQLAAEQAEPKPMRRGSRSERTPKCSKPSCACADDPNARHAPYFSLTRSVEGKTRSRFLTPEQAALARQQTKTGNQFCDKLEVYWQSCEDWADREWEVATTASSEEARKRGLQTNLQKEIIQEIETLLRRQ